MSITTTPTRMIAPIVGAAATFIPRSTFPELKSLPRSYFLGHHKAGLDKMRTLVDQIDMVIECRDYRIPLTSRNPLLEELLQHKQRTIVYTKHDLGCEPADVIRMQQRDSLIRRWHTSHHVHFSEAATSEDYRSTRRLVSHLKKYAVTNHSLTGHRVLVAGMPNVGKSTLLNSLRAVGIKKGKAAKTGAQPGVTRKVGSAVKIVDRLAETSGDGVEVAKEGIYVLDTPGVFMPYVPHPESMLKLALCGAVKDSIIAPVTLADYLLFHLNLQNPAVYAEYMPGNEPTNSIVALLEEIGRKTGRLGKGAVVDIDAAAMWLIQRWRVGHFGKFMLDDISERSLERAQVEDGGALSVSQAKKREREARRENMRMKGKKFRAESSE